MKKFTRFLGVVGLLALAVSQACSTKSKFPDVADSVHNALKQAGFTNVSVSQDRDKGVVTLTGKVAADSDKAQAESIARSIAGGQVVGNEIAVLPPGAESAAKTVNSDLDDGIKKNLDAALIQNHLHDDVKFDVKNGVVTLTGGVSSQSMRGAAQQVAAAVPNVQQVVNKIDVKDQRASSSEK
jgi:hyperosmotically inducible periplasmic protein